MRGMRSSRDDTYTISAPKSWSSSALPRGTASAAGGAPFAMSTHLRPSFAAAAAVRVLNGLHPDGSGDLHDAAATGTRFLCVCQWRDAGSTVWWAPWLAIAGVLNSALSLAYYGWLTRKIYFEGETEKRVSEPKSVIAIMIFSIIFLVGFGVYPDPIIKLVEFAAPTLSLGIMP